MINFTILAPVILFVYNRPEHTKKTLDALANNDLASQTVLFIFSDGPKNDASVTDLQKIDSVRQVIKNENRFKKIDISESNLNKGLSQSIISGITEVLRQYDKIIVLEDDVITHKCFLRFCNEALNKYESDESVKAISGFMFPIVNKLQTSFFLPYVACWGWATWRRSWMIFEADPIKLLNEIERTSRVKEFNFNGSYYFHGMLKAQIEGRINSWAIRWFASVFLKHGLMLFPGQSLTQNIGMDGSGIHYNLVDSKMKINNQEVFAKVNPKTLFNFPNNIEVDRKMQKRLEKYLSKESFNRPIDKIKNYMRKILHIKALR